MRSSTRRNLSFVAALAILGGSIAVALPANADDGIEPPAAVVETEAVQPEAVEPEVIVPPVIETEPADTEPAETEPVEPEPAEPASFESRSFAIESFETDTTDTAGPNLTVDTPVANGVISRNLRVEGTVDDESGVAEVTVAAYTASDGACASGVASYQAVLPGDGSWWLSQWPSWPGEGEYCLQVIATDALGNMTTRDLFVTLDLTTPDLRMSGPDGPVGRAHFQWELLNPEPFGVTTTIFIYDVAAAGAGYTPYHVSSGTTLDPDLAPGEYYWYARVSDAAGNSRLVASIYQFFVVAPPRIVSPSAGATFDDELDVSWSRDEMRLPEGWEILGVAVEFTHEDGESFTTYLDASATELDQLFTPDQPDGGWSVRVLVDWGGGGVWSDPVVVTRGRATPRLVSPADGTVQAAYDIDYRWGAVVDADHYELRTSPTPTVDETGALVDGTTAEAAGRTHRDTVTEDQLIWWQVRAIGADEVAGAWTSPWKLDVYQGWVSPSWDFGHGDPIISPRKGAILDSHQVTLSWVGDESGYTSQYGSSLGGWVPYTGTAAVATPQTVTLSDGVYSWYAKRWVLYAFGNFHEEDSPTRTFTVDTTAPVITLAVDADAPVAAGTPVVLTGEITDLTATTARVFLDDSDILAFDPGGTTIDTTGFAPATYTLRVDATDAVGHVGSKSITFEVAPNPAPVIEVTSPTAGDVITSGSLTLSGSVTDTDLTEWTAWVEGGPRGAAVSYPVADGESAGELSQTVDASAWPDGNYVLSVSAVDAAGSTSRVDTSIRIDNALARSAITAPTAGQTFTTPGVRVIGQLGVLGTPNYTLDDDEPQTVPGGVALPVGATSRPFSFDLTRLSEGEHTVTVSSGSVSVSRTFFVELAPRITDLTWVDGSWVSTGDTITVGATVEDTSQVAYGLTIAGRTVTFSDFGAAGPISPSVSTAGLADDDYQLELHVKDKQGNTTIETWTVHLDARPERPSLTAPRAGASTSAHDIDFSWRALDDADYYEFRFVGEDSKFTGDGENFLHLDDLVDGDYSWQVRGIERLDESTVNEGEWSKVRTLHIGTSDSGSGSTDESEEAGAVAADEPATEEPTAEEPTAEEPTTDEPTTDEPTEAPVDESDDPETPDAAPASESSGLPVGWLIGGFAFLLLLGGGAFAFFRFRRG